MLLASTGAAQILPFKNYTVKNGLLSNDIEAIAQDSRGFIWFGTSDGISVFDGQGVKNYTTRQGLPNNFVHQIIRDRRTPGTMWILAGTTVCRYRDGEFHAVDLKQGGTASIHQDRKGRIWCATWAGPVIIDGDSIGTFDLPPLRDGYKEMVEAGDTVVWFALDTSLVRYSPNHDSYKVIKLPGGIHGIFHSMAPDDEGNLWIARGWGALLLIRDTVVLGESPGGNSVNTPDVFGSGFLDASGNRLLLYGYNGITTVGKDRFMAGPEIRYTVENGLVENTIRSAFIDREENLWLGGRDHGVMKLSAWDVIRFPLGGVYYAQHHQFATADSNGHLWILADNNLREFWKDRYGGWHSQIHQIRPPAPIGQFTEGRFSSIYYDTRGKLWVSSFVCPGPIECYDVVPDASPAGDRPSGLKLLRTIRAGAGMKAKWMRIYSIIVSTNGDLWVFIAGAGLARYRIGLEEPFVRLYGPADGIPMNYMRNFYESRSGDIWAGSYGNGLVRITPAGKIMRYSTKDGLHDDAVHGVNEDHSGRLLIGTSNAGLAFMAADSSGTFSSQSGLPSNKVFAATEDSLHRLWVATSLGMVHEERAGSGTFVEHQEFLGAAALACGTTRDGLVWFVTPDELIVYDPALDPPETTAPLIHIDELKVNGNPAPAIVDVRSSADQNNFEIGYVGVSFRDESAIRYYYRLVGADARWHGPTSNRSVTYGHLDPGTYRFEVSAVSVSGMKSEAPATILLTIERPFWQGGWFIGGMASITAAMAWGAFRLRTGRLLREQQASAEFSRRLIDSQEAERKRVAGELHDGVGQYFLVILSRAKMALRESARAASASDLEEIVATAGQGIEDVRRVAFGLSPYDIGQFGLASSVETMLKRLTVAAGMRYTVNLAALNQKIADAARIHVYRIVQECVTNVIKHAGASEVAIEARDAEGHLSISIRDDGRGFDHGNPQSKDSAPRGFGLAGLRERVKLLNGSLQIDSRPGGGTSITVVIPHGAAIADGGQNGSGK